MGWPGILRGLRILTLWVLAWSVYVIASRHQDRNVERLGVGPDVHFRGGLGRRVRVGRHELARLVKEPVHCIAIHLVGADVDEAPHATGPLMQPYGVEQPLCGYDIIQGKGRRILK